MKRIFSLLLVLCMIVPLGIISVKAESGAGYCRFWSSSEAYCYIDGVKPVANDTIVEFDAILLQDNEGNTERFAFWDANNSEITISTTYVSYNGQSVPFKWGNLAWTNWRHIKYEFYGSTLNLSIDGVTILSTTTPGCRSGGLILFSYAGEFGMDNLVISNSSGIINRTCDFESLSDMNELFNIESLGKRVMVQGTGTETGLVDVKSVKFTDAASVSSYVVAGSSNTVPVTVTYGDMNADGKINIRDSLCIKLYFAGKIAEPTINLRNADINKDGSVRADDHLELKLYFVGKRATLPETETIYVPVDNGASAGTATAAFDTTENGLKITATAADPSVYFDLSSFGVTTADYKCFTMVYKIPSETSTAVTGEALPCAGTVTKDTATAGTTATLTSGVKYYVKSFDFTGVTGYSGNVNGIVFKPDVAVDGTVYVDSIYLSAEASDTTSTTAAILDVRNAGSGPVTPVPKGEYDGDNYVIRFDSDDKASIVSNSNNSTVGYSSSESALKCQTTAQGDPSVYANLTNEGLSANTFKYITYVYKVPTTTQRSGPQMNLYYVCNDIDVPTGGYESSLYSLTKNGCYCYIVVDLTEKPNWTGDIKGLRIDYFTDCYTNDIAYIDSIYFATSDNAARTFGNSRVTERNPVSANSPADVFNMYRQYYLNANSYEFMTISSGGDYYMHFKYNTDVSKFTARSLGDRLARAITNATGVQVTAEVYTGYAGLKDSWNDSQPSNYVYYTIYYNNNYYVVRLMTFIIKDSSFNDSLDGTPDDPVISSENLGTWAEDGISFSGVSTLIPGSGSGGVAHSCHECRVVDTPYGTFIATMTYSNEETWSTLNTAKFSVYRIYDNGTSKILGTYDMSWHTSKPNIFYAADGMVYFMQCDDQSQTDSCHITMGYFDPSKPNSDGSYDITVSVVDKQYVGGAAPSGYGYIQPILDDLNHRIVIMCCGGNSAGWFGWFIYDYNTKSFENGFWSTIVNTNRHCYLYGYSDGADGMYVVGGRDVLLSELGLQNTVYNIDYAFDEINLFHFTNMHSSNYTRTCVTEADYSQVDRRMFPDTICNTRGDVFLDSQGYLHVIDSTSYFAANHDVLLYRQMYYNVYDVRGAGAAPKLVYSKPIAFGNEKNTYFVRMTESTTGQLYIVAMNDTEDSSARCEIWRQKTDSYDFEMVGCKNFSAEVPPRNSLIIGNSRNGSVIDDTISVIYPKGWGGPYGVFFVNIK